MKAAILIIVVLLASVPAAMQAYAQQSPPPPSQQQIITSISGPIFQNAYWTDANATGTTRKEVGPGDGASTLAVVLVNRGFSDITSIKGTLSLPQGFAPAGMSATGNRAVATFDNIVEGSDTFTLLFDVNVLDSAKVGTYSASLDVEYSNILEIGSFRHASITVPFRLTGKVILEPVAVTRTLEPGVTNTVDFEIRNTGTGPATGVTVSIAGITSSTTTSSQGQIANFGSRTFAVGTIPAGASATFSSSIFPTISASGSLAGVQLEITYNDAYGNTKTITPTVGMVVQQSALSLIGVKAVGQEGERLDNQIIAGRVDDFVLEISNKGDAPIQDAVVSIRPTSESINILGDSKWAVSSITPGSSASLPTRVFASSSLIGSSTAFDVTIDYLLEGESKSEQVALGTYVDGEITIRVYDLAINYIGGTPNLVGNLLNEGNTDALFTTVEIVPSPEAGGQLSASGPQQQYLGDLTENSPLPFSIPLSGRSLEPGTYPVTLKLTYKDNLRNTHELVTDASVVLEQGEAGAQTAGGQRPGGQAVAASATLPVIIAVIVAAGIAVFFFRRRRTKAKKASAQESEDDITALLGNSPEQAAADPKGPDRQ